MTVINVINIWYIAKTVTANILPLFPHYIISPLYSILYYYISYYFPHYSPIILFPPLLPHYMGEYFPHILPLPGYLS